MSEHTELPWRIDICTPESGEFILRSVNSHAAAKVAARREATMDKWRAEREAAAKSIRKTLREAGESHE